MNKRSFLVLTLVFCFVLFTAGLSFFKTGAQTNMQSQRPTATPTPAKAVSPTPAPTIETDDEPIKIDTELVNLNVRVVDRNNRSIANLSQNDFTIYEDNVPQKIEFFSKSEVPTNYAMVIDNSGSMRLQLDKVIEASKIIVNTNRADDETSIIRFVDSEKIEITQEFTANKGDILESLDNLFIEGGPTAIIDAVYLAAERVDQYEKTKNPNDHKRRALILVSDGEDRDSFYKEQQLFDLLRESDVQIYAIGFVNELSKEGGFISKSPQGKAKAFLERLAKETGGKVYFPNSLSELNGIAQDIANELRTQYLISYQPAEEKKDVTYRAIKVTVKDGPTNEKRIAITRTGIQKDSKNSTPSLQNPNKIKTQ
ncbi:MAG TPA: VWA domain-containing protein [Pyrinomonadaceae bacterium]|jgi:Ca-activated chloride channel family protein